MEIWKTIDGFERYKVSNLSRILDTKRNVILVPYNHNKNYKRIALNKNKKQHHLYFHRLLAYAFIPNPENKPFINHIDGNPSNNLISNLEWCTQKENVQHAYRTGLSKSTTCELARNAKITNIQAIEIASQYGILSVKELMSKYGMSKSTINNILTGRSWSEVTGVEKRRLQPNKKSRWDK